VADPFTRLGRSFSVSPAKYSSPAALEFNEVKERWPDLTHSDVEYIDGSEDKLSEVGQMRRHISAEEARRDIDEFLRTLDVHQRIA